MARLLENRERVVRRGLGFAGSIGAILFFCLSLTPSLLPRHWVLQGLLSGITMAIGYGAAAALAAVVRTIWPRVPAVARWGWMALAATGLGLAVVFLRLGDSWQREVRQLVAADPADAWYPPLIVVVAAGVFALLLVTARSVRLATRRLAETFGRFSPRPVASVAALGAVAALSYVLGPGVVFTGFMDLAQRAAANASSTIAADATLPSSRYVSGGPGSLVPWRTLGAYGREFTAGAVPRGDLAAFAEGEAAEPIRVYVGYDSADTVDERATLAVRELERTGALDRAVLAVVTTTGTGWVNPSVPAALEYLYGGDSAVVAMQYSYLPSWISFVADRSSAAEAATTLIGAVQQRLAAVAAEHRPALVVYGESLGAHATETAFGDLDELLASTDGALLAGPPHTNPIWQHVMSERDPASPMWRPVYQNGDLVRFGQDDGDLSAADRPGLIYLQNASDPIVWWSPQLLHRPPAWLNGDRGPDVSGAMRWFPVVTFWQVTFDLLTSTKVSSGHGHSYGGSVADAWAALVPPPGWTDTDTAQLRTILS